MLQFLVLGEGTPSTTVGTLLAVTLSFLILLVLVKKFAWGAVVGMMQKREDKIASDLDSAEKSRVAADRLEQARQRQLQKSRSEAMEIVNTAKKNGQQTRQQILAEAQADADQYKVKAQQEISQQKVSAESALKGTVANLSLVVAEKLMQQELDQKGHKQLIDSYLKELENLDETR
ncbi:F0F1 ATP synthase subunit B [Enterococcus hirae]|jgi:F-type H+-transporting ATPase subunit b|nr:F0F1 ATP synthase subunit B [Enterococcaceae bacterium]MCI1918755.1 F0F1 ATP synthase subunit B [Enterococcaceae bacterium]MDM8214152.1 F0F1 ATP synthase subunit B [Enterococcus hirae]